MTLFLGIDPGLQKTGYAFVEYNNLTDQYTLSDCGIIMTQSDMSFGERLFTLRTDILSLFEEYSPEYLTIELLYFSKNIKTALTVAHARGVILEAVSQQNIQKIIEPTPTQIKQILTGNGKANKKDLQLEIQRIFDLEKIVQPDDANDAIAIAIAGIRMSSAFLSS